MSLVSKLPPGVRRLFKLPVRGSLPHEDIDDEVGFHLAMRIAALRKQGLSASEAEREALRRFGDLDEFREAAMREADRWGWFKRLRHEAGAVGHDVRLALRRLRGSPMFTIAATLTLAIAIGATASVFGVVDAVLLKAFPYRATDRILTIWESNRDQHQSQVTVATGNYLDWAAQNRSFTGLAATCCDGLWFTVTRPQEAEHVNALAVTANYFSVLGITPILGRPLAPDTSGPSEVVLSYGYWQRRYGGQPSALGQHLTLDNANDARPTPRHTYTIVGVMPPGLPGNTEMWTLIFFEPRELTMHDIRYLDVYGRLRPGITAAGAQRELETIAQRLAVAYPKTNEHWSVSTTSLLDQLVGPVRPALLLLLAAAGCVLLVGTANLANLFLVRCLAREREMAVRTAIGATRGQLVRQLVLEASVLAVGAGALGVGFAAVGVRMLRSLAPHTLPRQQDVGMDGVVVACCAVTSLASVFVFGLLPAWRVSRGNLSDALKEGGRGTGSAQYHRLQDAFVVGQVAIALMLLTGAGLLAESFVHFVRLDPGFRPGGVLTARLDLTTERYPTRERTDVFRRNLLDRLEKQPGFEAASISDWIPGNASSFGAEPFSIVGDPVPDQAHAPAATGQTVSLDYFRTLGIKLIRGRLFEPSDDRQSVAVALVDQLLAKRFFDGRDPIGRRIITIARDTLEIVGIVASIHERGLAADRLPTFYRSYEQSRFAWIAAFLEVRVPGKPLANATALKAVVASVDPLVSVSDIQSMHDRMMQSVGTTTFASVLASLFAVVALVLGMVGIYSVLAYIVSQRQRETAVRIALGARAHDVMRDVLVRALSLSCIGIAMGTLAAWLLTRALAGLFLGVDPHDPTVFLGAVGLFVVVAALATSIPAFRTTRVNPVVALTST